MKQKLITVGVRELKASLSSILKDVHSGGVRVFVTDRNVIIAEIGPALGSHDSRLTANERRWVEDGTLQ